MRYVVVVVVVVDVVAVVDVVVDVDVVVVDVIYCCCFYSFSLKAFIVVVVEPCYPVVA